MLQFNALSHLSKREKKEAILLPFWEKKGMASPAASMQEFEKFLKFPLESKDFSGKEGEIALIYVDSDREKRCILIGLGPEEKFENETARKSFGAAARFCQKKKIKAINLLVPTEIEGIAEGLLLPNYHWTLKEKKEQERSLLEEVTFIGVSKKFLERANDLKQIAESVYFARDLINGNADTVTPKFLAETAKKLSTQFPSIKHHILDKKGIEKEKLGLLYAVGKGATNEPVLITLQYDGNPRSKERTVIVGKGITFDTGGLNLKSSNMETMRDDMSGGACVFGVLAACAALKLKVNVSGVIPAAENAIDANSFKPGDVYISYLGKTVEIGDTDAEGRLVLADALAYSVKNLKPTRIINFATLTGSIVVALGDSIAGLFSNNDQLARDLENASRATGEVLWRMPLYAPYKEQLKSDIADLKNIGGRPGGSIKAALFLEEFVSQVPWAHLDIAGVAFSNKESAYLPKNGIGYGIRLILQFLKK